MLMRTHLQAITLSLLILLSSMLSGCSIFGSPTPKTNVTIVRATSDSRGNPVPSDTLEMPETWASGTVFVIIEEKYFDPSTYTAENEFIESRKIVVFRLSENDVAERVASERAQSALEALKVATSTIETIVSNVK